MNNIYKIYLLLSVALIFAGCGKKEETKLETFSAEAFAYDIDAAWEINSSIRVKGFTQSEEGSTYKYSVSYTAGLITPSGETIADISTGTLNEPAKEKQKDLGIDIQYELDKAKGAGKYKIVFVIKDDLSGKTVKAEKEFDVM